MSDAKHRDTCRVSGEKLVPLFSLGDLYVSDFLKKDEEPKSNKIPLAMMLAPTSGLVQLADTASSEDMYRRYWYQSATNESMVAELKDIAQSVAKLMRV